MAGGTIRVWCWVGFSFAAVHGCAELLGDEFEIGGASNASSAAVSTAASGGATSTVAMSSATTGTGGTAGIGEGGSCPQIDQQQLIGDDFLVMAPWQSFIPQLSGALVEIELFISTYDNKNSGQLRVYSGVGIQGTLLHQQPWTLPSTAEFAWQTFTLTAPLGVTAGNEYTWELTGANALRHSLTDAYAFGMSSNSAYDFAFRTIVDPCAPR